MKISVVTACFNSAETIRFTLDSFLRQGHPEKELLVLDGGSTDGTCEIVRSYDDPQISLVSEPDRGIYDAMNKGLARFSGDAVGFLNSDDCFADADALAAITTGLRNTDIVHGHLDFVSGHYNGKVVRSWRTTPHRPGAFRSGWMPAHPTFYIRREVAEAVGRFDITYRIAADYDFMLRAVELHGFRSAVVDRVLVRMLHGGSSTSGLRAYVSSNLESLRSRQIHIGAGAVDAALMLKPLRKLHQIVAW